MRETCGNCTWGVVLPFSDNEITCMCENSDFADCPCRPDDTCGEFEEQKNEDRVD